MIGQADNAHDLVELVDRNPPDVAVIDIKMPPDTHRRGPRRRPNDPQQPSTCRGSPALPLCRAHIRPTSARYLPRARVGYLFKDRVTRDRSAGRDAPDVSEGECVIDPTIVSRFLGRQRVNNPLAGLTAREREVLSLVAEGQSNKSIARELFVTDRTVEAHVSQIFLKLHIDEHADFESSRCARRRPRASEPERLALRSTDLRERH